MQRISCNTRSPQDAEDIVQSAGIRMLSQRIDPVDERGFAYTIVDHEAHTFLDHEGAQKRNRGKTEPIDPSNPSHQRVAPSAEQTALQRMEIREADPLARLNGAGYTVREIAEATGMNLHTVSSHIDRWRKKASGEREDF
ncbi:MAG: sigma-70 family RNA polymerase sigma factor [Candidatus Levybacteria bacterium]|nr:sigma-70 family RNA polymerase sigma factor [Candidatus Levybacteria bacterium]